MIRIFICFTLTIFLFATLTSCRTVRYNMKYYQLIGNHYILLKDCYITQSLHDKKLKSLYPCGVMGFPRILNKKNIDRTVNGQQIIGFAPKDSKFVLMRVTEYDLDDHINLKMRVPIISLSSKYNDIALPDCFNEYLDDSLLNKQLAAPCP